MATPVSLGGGAYALGNAVFYINANTGQFTQQLNTAQQQAQQFGQSVGASFNSLLIIPRQLAALNQSVMATTNAVANLEAALAKVRSAGGGGGQLGGGAFNTSSLLAFAYAIDDLQYGLQGVLNNVAQLGAGLGAAMGLAPPQAQALAAGLQIAAVAANQLYQHWDDLFGDAEKLPRVKEGLDGLTESLRRIREAIGPIKQAFDEMADGERGMLATMADQMGFGAASLKNRLRLERLQQLEGEAKQKLSDERVVESMGPEQTKVARETAEAFRKAVADLPEGSETLMDVLQDRGMTFDEARKAVAGAGRGNVGNLQDILEKIPEADRNGVFGGLRKALPSVREADRRNEEEVAKFHRDREAKEKDDRLVDELNRQGQENQREWIRQNMRDEIEGLQDKKEALQEARSRVAKETKPFTGEYFDFAKKLGESALERQKLGKLTSIDAGIKLLEKAIKAKQREAARAG